MGSPRSIRFDEAVLDRLVRYTRRHPGSSLSSVANRFVDEGLRTDEHPGIVFRDGPAGRRAGLVGGPDVAEVIGALHAIRADRPRLTGDALVEAVADASELSPSAVRAAVAYYASYPDEIDAWIAANDEAAAQAEAAWHAERRILGDAS